MSTRLTRKGEKVVTQIIFLGPAALIYIVFLIIPICLVIYYSLTYWNGITPPVFIGLENFKELLTSSDYHTVLMNTLIEVTVACAIQIPLGLILAYLLYTAKKGARFFKLAFFFPVVISQTAVAIMFTLFFNSDIGPINSFFSALGLHFLERQWLSDSKVVLWSVMTPMIWQWIGFYIVIFFAALQSIPQEIFESAVIDGASSFKIFTKLVIPLLKEFEVISAIFVITGGLKAFEHSYVMTWGGPGFSSSFLTVYMYRVAFLFRRLDLGSAIGVTILVLSLVFTIVFRKFFSRESTYLY